MRVGVVSVLFFTAGLMAFQAPQVVNISLDTSGSQPRVVVSPDRAVVNAGGKIRWVSSGNRQDRIEIDFDSKQGKKGPFPAENSQDNPSRGRYNKRVGSPILTRAAADRGDWKYTVTWVTANGTRYPLDPIIVIR